VRDDVGDTDFDCGATTWERAAMTRAKRALIGVGVTFRPVGRDWLRIDLGIAGGLFLAPNTGSLRFQGGKVFSSRGLPLALKIWAAYR
jgi:hypothetical protein